MEPSPVGRVRSHIYYSLKILELFEINAFMSIFPEGEGLGVSSLCLGATVPAFPRDCKRDAVFSSFHQHHFRKPFLAEQNDSGSCTAISTFSGTMSLRNGWATLHMECWRTSRLGKRNPVSHPSFSFSAPRAPKTIRDCSEYNPLKQYDASSK